MIPDVIQIIAENGPWIGCVAILAAGLVAYIRRDWKRMDALEKRVGRLEDELRQSYRELLAPCQEALVNSNKLLERYFLRD